MHGKILVLISTLQETNVLNHLQMAAAKFCQLNILVAFTVLLLMSGCATTNSVSEPETQVSYADPRDPLESINRPLWDFNWNVLDKYVLKPVSQGYVKYTPSIVRTGLYNAALNLNEPSTVVNDVLQLKFKDAAVATGRFVINSTVGIFGLFDPASKMGLKRQQEGFDEVLGVWGIGNGPYLMVPGMGPSDVRSQAGNFVDRYYWPLAVIDFWPNVARVLVLGLEGRASLAQQEKLIEDSFDSYEFVKNAHFQNVEFKVYDGNPPQAEEEIDIDAYLDELDN